MSSDSSCSSSPSEGAEAMALDLSTKSCPAALRCIRSNLYKPRRASPYLRVPKAVRFSVDGVVTTPARDTRSTGCGCESLKERENLPPKQRKEFPKETDSGKMVHPSILQEDRLRELDRLLQRVTQKAAEEAAAQDHKPTPPKLPQDPRDWSREQVHSWLTYMQTTHSLAIIPCDRFQMNGKGLCLMSAAMFSQRVPCGGKLLYKDFRIRLCQAMAGIIQTF